VIDKQTKKLLLIMLPKWLALIILVTVIWSYIKWISDLEICLQRLYSYLGYGHSLHSFL